MSVLLIAACCGWDLPKHKRIPLDSKSAVIRSTCMEAVDDQLWVGCGNMINIVDPATLVLEVNRDCVLCFCFITLMVCLLDFVFCP